VAAGYNLSLIRCVAQPGSALAWGARGRRFESFHTDQKFSDQKFSFQDSATKIQSFEKHGLAIFFASPFFLNNSWVLRLKFVIVLWSIGVNCKK
jgi:hypothetical protein